MSLLNSMGSNSSPTIRLLLLESLPTTDDLRYMLAEGTKTRKSVQLPFKRERDAPVFVITFSHPNRWQFERGDGISATTIWTKESSDVMVVQNKMKTDSAVYSNQGGGQQDHGQSPGSVPNFAAPNSRESLSRIFPDRAAQQAADPTSNYSNQFATQPPQSMPFGNWLTDDESSQSSTAPAHPGTASAYAEKKRAKEAAGDTTTATGDFVVPNNMFESWMPEDRSSTLPPPVELDPNASADVADLLRDPSTGLTSFQALTFFLIRELIRSDVSHSSLSVVVFDFVDVETEAHLNFSNEQMEALINRLSLVCSTLHIASRMESGEYVVLLCDAKTDDAKGFAEMLRHTFSEDDQLVYLCAGTTLSIGIATAPETSRDAGTLIAAARQMKDVARTTGNSHLTF
jgi:GGDEF domain-containing protein